MHYWQELRQIYEQVRDDFDIPLDQELKWKNLFERDPYLLKRQRPACAGRSRMHVNGRRRCLRRSLARPRGDTRADFWKNQVGVTASR